MKKMTPYLISWLCLALVLTACATPVPTLPPQAPTGTATLTAQPPTATSTFTSTLTPVPPTATFTPQPQPQTLVPAFAHIVMIVLENKDYSAVIGSPQMPYFNQLARENVLLTQHYAITHPSLPNYLALIGGDTFGITSDCDHCYINAQSLPDLLEASGRTWKTYQEDLPAPCFLGNRGSYAQRHNPFIYFDAIRTNAQRCQNSVVALSQLETDLAAGTLPNFSFISPNVCNDSHDCDLKTTDTWLEQLNQKLIPALEATQQPYLLILTWDEGNGDEACCGLPAKAGGRVATVLISPQAKTAFQDETPYTHYSLLKTFAAAWTLPALGHAADDNNVLIMAPWK